MNKEELLSKIRNKFRVRSNNQLAKYLGITSSAFSQYAEDVTPENVARIVESAWIQGLNIGLEFGIFPIAEFFPINHSDSRRGKNWEILPVKSEASERDNQLREKLKSSIGIYFFYNSECKVIYVGKTEDQDLWSEMKQTFNREISTYKYNYVSHPDSEKELSSPLSSNRRIISNQAYLFDTAFYFSAYTVAQPLINNLEAFLVRALPNDLRNTKKENFKYPNIKWHGEPKREY
jgi:hypothetical protein